MSLYHPSMHGGYHQKITQKTSHIVEVKGVGTTLTISNKVWSPSSQFFYETKYNDNANCWILLTKDLRVEDKQRFYSWGC